MQFWTTHIEMSAEHSSSEETVNSKYVDVMNYEANSIKWSTGSVWLSAHWFLPKWFMPHWSILLIYLYSSGVSESIVCPLSQNENGNWSNPPVCIPVLVVSIT